MHQAAALWYKSPVIPPGREILLIHMGGLGDVCLSASTFLSLRNYFGRKLTALGYPRFLGLFDDCFSSVHSIDGREWLHLFADNMTGGARWNDIVFIGKDPSGAFRRRLTGLSQGNLIFVDMFPDSRPLHVEAHQLRQLKAAGIEPVRRPIEATCGRGIVIYPERGFRKQKWPYDSFLELYTRLHRTGVPALLLEPFDTEKPHPDSFRFDHLVEVKRFLRRGSLFLSNDCGVAHLAASCGLATITLFHEADPAVWHPLGNNLSLTCSPVPPTVDDLLAVIYRMME